jgi:hypothetical protein
MPDEPGWIFYVHEPDGQIRNFTVGLEDQQAAELAIQQHDPNVNILGFVSKMRADAHLIKMLGLSGGKVMEWRTADHRDSMSIHPGSVDIGSDYDPLRRK